MRISLAVEDGALTATISGVKGLSVEYCFYLLRDGDTVHREPWGRVPQCQWPLDAPGIYKVRGFVRKDGKTKAKFSKPHDHVTGKVKHAWRRLLAADPAGLPAVTPPPFVPVDYPHHDFAVIHRLGPPDPVQVPPQLATRKIAWRGGGESLLLSTRGSVPLDGCQVAFSGTTQLHDPFIFGQDDIGSMSIAALFTAGGDYTAVVISEDRIDLTNDYFGVNRLYLFERDGGCIVANSYHLLLILIRACGLPAAVDQEACRALLTAGTTLTWQQFLSHRLPVAGARLVPVDQRVELNEAGCRLVEKEIRAVLELPGRKLGQDEYLERLEKGRNEILGNLAAVLAHPRFGRALVDLSGGMDSRVVYGALLNLERHTDKVRIYSKRVGSLPNDLPVALTVNNAFGVPYDDIDEERHATGRRALLDAFFSQVCGTYFLHNPDEFGSVRTLYPGTIQVAGISGEICLRPFNSRGFLGTGMARLGLRAFIRRFLRQHNHSAIGSKDDLRALDAYFTETVGELPGTSAIRRFEQHYLFFRNGLHFSDRFRFDRMTPRVGALQSKEMLRLKMDTLEELPPIKLQNDLIAIFSPRLAEFPYESETNNRDRAAAVDELYRPDPQAAHDLPQDASDTAQREARSRKTIRTLGTIDAVADAAPDFQGLAESALRSLVVDHQAIGKSTGRLLLMRLSRGSLSHVTRNKVIMLCQQLAIVGAARDRTGGGRRRRRGGKPA